MTTHVRMPALGETMDEGKIVRWVKQIGDRVEAGEILLEVESDKATLEVESTFSGYLRAILHAEGEDVPAGEPIALMTPTVDEPLTE
ncbi:biotin attachment protein [candidate division KSB3 bacterium]|uniref:Biotin attachment protein n=1 Tax=candidate division KSB3 bacterium TaxID=2044937 RepID=A0A9D5JX41_9BACT|nr:biotin attachment protein [candidate division KSB3 bacterium]MBD3325735.1 biotin attachment protein [candidate division KSB3 bacterium]